MHCNAKWCHVNANLESRMLPISKTFWILVKALKPCGAPWSLRRPCEGMHDMMENILLGGFGTDMVYHGIAMHAQKFKKKVGQYCSK